MVSLSIKVNLEATDWYKFVNKIINRILQKVQYQHQYEVDCLLEKACLVGCLLLICSLAKHLVHVEVVVAQNGAEGVQEKTWQYIF